MLVQRILTALALGALSVSALPGPAEDAAPEEYSLEWLQEPLHGHPHFDVDDTFGPSGPPGPPGHPPPPPHLPPNWNPDVSKKTIYEFLKEDDHFTRFFKLVNFTDGIASTLNDSSAGVTLFAPPDAALKRPKRGHGHGKRCSAPSVHPDNFEECFFNENKDSDPTETLSALEALVDEDHDEHKKKILKRILKAILSYHILPHSLSEADLSKNTTFGTTYTPQDGAFDGKPLRIHVDKPFKFLHPSLVVNFYAKILKADVQTANGLVHVTNNPILPPPAAFQELFLFSDHFSTFTSAIQRVGLTEETEWRYVRGKGDEKGTFEGSPSITIFAPINSAFKKLPWKLKLFLFSPFGEKVLEKLLKFHVVPEIILYSDYFHNATESFVDRHPEPECCMDEDLSELQMFDIYQPALRDHSRHVIKGLKGPCSNFHAAKHSSKRKGFKSLFSDLVDFAKATTIGPFVPILPIKTAPSRLSSAPGHCACAVAQADPIYAHSGHLPTLLKNHTLHIEVAQYEHRSPIPPHRPTYVKKIVAQGVVVKLPDVVARNGAVHVIDHLLNPRGKRGDHGHGHHHHGPHRKHAEEKFVEHEEDEWEGWEDWLVKWAEEN